MNTESENFSQILNEIYAKAIEDAQFKDQISKDGIGALKERGVLLPENVEVHFLIGDSENSRIVISIPLVPPLNDEALESVAGGHYGNPGDDGFGDSGSIFPIGEPSPEHGAGKTPSTIEDLKNVQKLGAGVARVASVATAKVGTSSSAGGFLNLVRSSLFSHGC